MKTILIIDDQEAHTEIMFNILVSYSYNPLPRLTSQLSMNYREFKDLFINYIYQQTSENINNLKTYIDKELPHLFIVDLDLKDRKDDDSGKTVAKKILHVYYPKIPILYVSQYPAIVVSDVLRPGDDFLQKASIGSKNILEYLENNLPGKVDGLLNKI